MAFNKFKIRGESVGTPILLIILFCAATNIRSQILYTDINPDYTLNSPSYNKSYKYNIDINQDSTFDFLFTRSMWTEFLSPSSGYCTCHTVQMHSLYSDAYIGLIDTSYDQGTCNYVDIDSGVVVNNQAFYWKKNTILEYVCAKYKLGCKQNINKRYIPVKLINSGISYFGWIQVQNSMTFYDMAINLSPNDSIISGQTVLSSAHRYSSSPDMISIYFDAINDKIIVNNSIVQNNIMILLYNSLGELVDRIPILNVDRVLIDASKYPTGLYICSLISSEQLKQNNKIMIFR